MSPQIPSIETPSDRFKDLPDFPYEPHYIQYGNLHMAYVDERSSGSEVRGGEEEVFLCLHGQPTWSYLYRRMIPVFLNYRPGKQGSSSPSHRRRVVAPDLFGFGRSSKPTREEDYTYNFHRDSLLHFIETLNLRNVTLVVQDWGGLLGLTLPVACPWRFKRFIVMNTTIAVGQYPGKGFTQWRDYSNRTPDMDVGALIARGNKHLSQAEVSAYNAPYPNAKYKAGVRRFPNLVMTDPGMEGVEISRKSVDLYMTSSQWKIEAVFMACGQQDPVLGEAGMRKLAKMWKNGCYYLSVDQAGHFTQEWGGEIARTALEVFADQEVTNDKLDKVVPGQVKL